MEAETFELNDILENALKAREHKKKIIYWENLAKRMSNYNKESFWQMLISSTSKLFIYKMRRWN